MKQPITFRDGQQVCPLGQGTYQMGRRRNEEIKALRRGGRSMTKHTERRE